MPIYRVYLDGELVHQYRHTEQLMFTQWPGCTQIEEPDPVEPPPPGYSGSWHISKTAFRNRFTQSERVALELAALHNPALAFDHPSNLLAAALRSSMADQRDALYIDLQRSTVLAGVQSLEAGGLLAAGRATQIVLTPPTDEELYRG